MATTAEAVTGPMPPGDLPLNIPNMPLQVVELAGNGGHGEPRLRREPVILFVPDDGD